MDSQLLDLFCSLITDHVTGKDSGLIYLSFYALLDEEIMQEGKSSKCYFTRDQSDVRDDILFMHSSSFPTAPVYNRGRSFIH